MKNIRNVRKFLFEGDIVCIAVELLEYMGINTSLNRIIEDKILQKGFDYEVIPRHLVDNKINLSMYKNMNEIIVLKQSGIFKIINNRRQTESIDVSNYFQIPLKFIKEREFLGIIKSAFSNYDCKQQFFVPKEDKNGYFIDLYIKGKDKNIAVEVDENGHTSYDSEFEIHREKYIKEKLGCEFIRFNPDDKNFNIGAVINKIMNTKVQIVNTKIEFVDNNPHATLIIRELISELNKDKPSIVEFVESLEIENILNDIGNKLTFTRDARNNKNTIILVDDIPLINSKDIIEEVLSEIDGVETLKTTIQYFNKTIDKMVKIEYIVSNNLIHIKLKEGLKKHIYIKDYVESINCGISKELLKEKFLHRPKKILYD